MSSTIYLIGQPGSDIAKIGITTNLHRRFEAIRMCSPVPLEILWRQAGGTQTERTLHRYFDAGRLHGEWFRFATDPVAEVQQALREIRSSDHWENRSKPAKTAREKHEKIFNALRDPDRVPASFQLSKPRALYLDLRTLFRDDAFTARDAATRLALDVETVCHRMRTICAEGLAVVAGHAGIQGKVNDRRLYRVHPLPDHVTFEGNYYGARSHLQPEDTGA